MGGRVGGGRTGGWNEVLWGSYGLVGGWVGVWVGWVGRTFVGGEEMVGESELEPVGELLWERWVGR